MRKLAALGWLLASLAGCSDAPPPPAQVRALEPVVPTTERAAPTERERATEESVTLRGRVLDPRGRPLSDFSVSARLVDDLFGGLDPQTVTASSDGSFELSRVPPGRILVRVSAAGFAPSLGAPLELPAGASVSDLVVRVSVGGTLVGRVVDAHTIDPVVGAEVRSFDALFGEGERFPMARTGADGRFQIEHVPAGDGSLKVRAAGYAIHVVEDVHVADGATTELPLVGLSFGATVCGIVRGPDGVAPGASLQLTPADAGAGREARIARANEAGRFRIEHVMPGFYRLSAIRAGLDDPFEKIGDMKDSQREVGVAEGESYEFELRVNGE